MRLKYYILKPARSAQMRASHIPNFCHLKCMRNTQCVGMKGWVAGSLLLQPSWGTVHPAWMVCLHTQQTPWGHCGARSVPLVFVIYCQEISPTGLFLCHTYSTSKYASPSLILRYNKILDHHLLPAKTSLNNVTPRLYWSVLQVSLVIQLKKKKSVLKRRKISPPAGLCKDDY